MVIGFLKIVLVWALHGISGIGILVFQGFTAIRALVRKPIFE